MNIFRQLVLQVLMRIKLCVVTRPGLKAIVLRGLAAFPGVKSRLMMAVSQPAPESVPFAIDGPEELSPRARKIYNDLKLAMNQRNRDRV